VCELCGLPIGSLAMAVNQSEIIQESKRSRIENTEFELGIFDPASFAFLYYF
jgi:hypothetical protein